MKNIALLMILSSCGPQPSIQISTLDTKNPIVNGTRHPQTVSLNYDQIMAIGFVTRSNGSNFCSGALIAARVAITAEHCVGHMNPEDVFFGINPNSYHTVLLPVEEILIHPTLDFVAMILSESAFYNAPNIRPLVLNSKSIDDYWHGRWVDAAGYGDTHTDETGLFFAAVQIESHTINTISVNGHGEQGICFGDSGGPIVWQENPGAIPVIIGTEISGNSSCVDRDVLARIDVVLPWLKDNLEILLAEIENDDNDYVVNRRKKKGGCQNACSNIWFIVFFFIWRLKIKRSWLAAG